jgi:hypothetical protein
VTKSLLGLASGIASTTVLTSVSLSVFPLTLVVLTVTATFSISGYYAGQAIIDIAHTALSDPPKNEEEVQKETEKKLENAQTTLKQTEAQLGKLDEINTQLKKGKKKIVNLEFFFAYCRESVLKPQKERLLQDQENIKSLLQSSLKQNHDRLEEYLYQVNHLLTQVDAQISKWTVDQKPNPIPPRLITFSKHAYQYLCAPDRKEEVSLKIYRAEKLTDMEQKFSDAIYTSSLTLLKNKFP